jgi:hypothetical protein
MPTTANNGLFVYRPLLTQMTIRRGIGRGGAGNRLAPLVRHTAINGVYFKRDRYRIGHIKTQRAPGEKVKRAETARGELVPFLTKDHSIDKSVPRELVDGMAESALFGELEQAAYEALNAIEHDHESKVRELLWGDVLGDFQAKYGADGVRTPDIKWDASGATIYKDIQERRIHVYKTTGFMPNTVFMPRDVLDVLQGDPNNEIGERIKYTSGELPDTSRLAAYFGVENVIVPESLDDTENPGQANSQYDWMWEGDNVGVFYIDPSNTRNKVTLASTFFTDMPNEPFLGVFTRYDQDTKSYIVRCNAYFDVHDVDMGAGAILFDVLT